MSDDKTNGAPGEDGQNELDAKLSFTVASVWRAERISCPHPHVLQSYLQGSLDGGAREFVAFHLQESECPYCNATIDDLKARDDDAKQPVLADMKDRLLRSTVAELGKNKA
ncbi:MAG: hypothetical protein KAI24_14230 [Planctomycetes bacterium]|nr:hypothetical protein [Planctomycetota bacterium]